MSEKKEKRKTSITELTGLITAVTGLLVAATSFFREIKDFKK